MKSFKQYLIEMESSDPTDSSQRNIVPPGSIPPPKMPAPTRLDPGSLPPGHDRPNGQQPLPPDIDWQVLDDRIQDLLGLYEDLMRMIGILPWDQFVEYMRTHFGNTTLRDRSDFDDWFRQYSQGKMHDWFDSQYPNSSIEQWRTFLDRLYEIYGEDLWRIFEREYFPSDVPENETPQEGPSERDRERARERWERENY
jgi:uncharacterized short protein YbdD (DUF466 family)